MSLIQRLLDRQLIMYKISFQCLVLTPRYLLAETRFLSLFLYWKIIPSNPRLTPRFSTPPTLFAALVQTLSNLQCWRPYLFVSLKTKPIFEFVVLHHYGWNFLMRLILIKKKEVSFKVPLFEKRHWGKFWPLII